MGAVSSRVLSNLGWEVVEDHVDAVLVLDRLVDGLDLRRGEGDDATYHLAALVQPHLDLVERVEDAVAAEYLAEVLGGGDDVIGLAVGSL